jgi:hypothetical protein
MRDYTPALAWYGKPIPAEHSALVDLYSANLIYTLHDKTTPSFLEQLLDKSARLERVLSLDVLRDGLVFREHNSDGKGDYSHSFESFDWKEIDYLDVRTTHIEIKLKSGRERFRSFEPTAKERRELAEKWSTYQQVGDIPSNVPLLHRDEALVEPQKAEPHKAGPGFLSRVREAIFFVLVLAVIAIGYPYYVGGGSLLQAVAPGVAEIAPDAAELAISKHPEWPATNKLGLRTITTTLHAAPLNFLTNLSGLRQNSLEYLWFVPIFWIQKLTSRETQVDFLADFFIENMNKPNP